MDQTGPPYATNYLANGGIRNVLAPAGESPATARANTTAFIDDQEVPYSLTWTGSFQRQVGQNWAAEVRYLGTRAIHLFTQNRPNIQAKVGNGLSGLPTFFSRPSQAQLDALTLALADIQARPRIVPRFAAAGFTTTIISFLANGNSTYHGLLTTRPLKLIQRCSLRVALKTSST